MVLHLLNVGPTMTVEQVEYFVWGVALHHDQTVQAHGFTETKKDRLSENGV